ncbi:MAG: GreA/GreB family elongation factor [Chthoniobacterales bacterium]|nr:GreA/GreB family elongation factor [Chthoniobacterales bacterium]
MSKAFTKEDIDPPERSGRARSAAGLPPGATNYITARGAKRLRDQLENLRRANDKDEEKIAQLEETLKSASVVTPPEEPGNEVGFGARVTLRDTRGQLTTFLIVGVDELALDSDTVSWISPLGRELLAAKLGDSVALPANASAKIVKIEYPTD